MSEREINQMMLGEIMGLCYEISTHSEADCFFGYSPHVNSFDVHVYEFGWTEHSKGEWYAMNVEITRDNMMPVVDKLYSLRAKLGGGL